MDSSDALVNLQLSDTHRNAIQQALAWLPCIAQPLGVVVAGSIIRGNPDVSSDLDVVVLHGARWRRRVQRWFNGTAVELFCNSEEWLHRCMREEAAQGRPVMAHMLVTGALLLDTDQRLASIISVARELMVRGPCMSREALLRDRYATACQVEDALDFGSDDRTEARLLRAVAVDAVVRHAYLRQNQFLPRRKERLTSLCGIEPEVALLLSKALDAPPLEAAAALREAAERVLGVSGFFEWDSGPEE